MNIKFLAKLAKIDSKSIKKQLVDFAKRQFENIQNSKSNDEIYFQLELLSQYLHRTPNQTLLILNQIINTKKPLKPKINTVKGWGKVKGKTHEDLLMKTIELLEKMRYLKQKEVFSLLLKMTQFKDEKIIKRANESLANMAKYNLYALKKIAYQPQLLLIEQIEKFNPEKIKKYFESLLIIQKELLNPSYEGFEDTDYQTLTIQSGTLVANSDLEKIRKKTIIALKKIFPLCTGVAQQKKVLETLNSAIHVPMEGGSEKLRSLILENTKNIIHYYIQLIPELENEIIQVIDKELKWLKKRYPDMEALKELEATLTKNGDYKMFTTLVGHQFNFEENIGWEKAEQQRKEKINELVSEINEENFESWEQKILPIAKGFHRIEENMGQYQYFNLFLDELAKAKPILAQKIIEQHEKDLEPFLLNLMGGILKSDNPKIAKAFIQKWTQSGQHLATCALVFAYVKKLDEPLLQSIFKKAKQTKNSDALINIIRSISNNYPESKHLTPLFLEVIQELTKLKDTRWINTLYFQKKSIITHLGEKDFDLILANLIFARNIDYEIEQILMPLAEKNSLKILDFLKNRILRQKNEKDPNYRAIPFHFSKLDKVFEKNETLVANELFKWFEEDGLGWEAFQLLKSTPPLNGVVDKKLAQLLQSKSENALKIFHTLMMVYQGLISLENKFVHVIIKDFPKEHAELMNYMSMAGKVVMGEYGFVEDLEKKKATLEKWKKDKRKYIREFVEKYSSYLTERIEYEKKRADEDLALRKSEFKG